MKAGDIKTEPSPLGKEDVGGATRIDAVEFTHMSQEAPTDPVFATLRIEYVPKEEILVWEYVIDYLKGYRDVAMSPEEAVHTITRELAEACQPMTLQVTSNYSSRGGVSVSPQGRWMHPDARDMQGPGRIITAGQ